MSTHSTSRIGPRLGAAVRSALVALVAVAAWCIPAATARAENDVLAEFGIASG